MFDSFAQLFPAQWRGGVLLLLAPLRLLSEWQPTIISAMLGGHPASRLFMWVVLLVPVLLLSAGMWCTALSFFTIPLPPGRGTFLTRLLMQLWDARRGILVFLTWVMGVRIAIVRWGIGL